MKKVGDKVSYKDGKVDTIVEITGGQDPTLYFLADENKDVIISGEVDVKLVKENV